MRRLAGLVVIMGALVAADTTDASSSALLALPASVPHAGATGGLARAFPCHGRAWEPKPEVVKLTFTCSGAEVTGFNGYANQEVREANDPEEAFGCQRTKSRSFGCEDIHSGAGTVGHVTIKLAIPVCTSGSPLRLEITPYLFFQYKKYPEFALTETC